MKHLVCSLIPALTVLLLPLTDSVAQDWSPEQRSVLEAIAALSAATAPGGGGAEAYGALLAPEYSRWTMGSDAATGKDAWVRGIRDWFQDGWRVADRVSREIDITVHDGYAFTRRIVTETFAGPNGEVGSPATAALSELWIDTDDGWRLLRVEIVVMPEL